MDRPLRWGIQLSLAGVDGVPSFAGRALTAREWHNEVPPLFADLLCGENCKKVATVVIGAAGAYIIYRCVRMLPSLAPPLWWTIPFNLATP
jgi:hypothetical protein